MSSAMLLVFFFFIAMLSQLDFTAAQIGVVYGTNGDNLPLPSVTVGLYKQHNIKRMRIYDTNHEILNALRGSGIELTVGILNQDLPGLDTSAWVRDNILPFPDVNFRHIIVGNEVRPGKDDTSQYWPLVFPAMQAIHAALPPELRESVKVTTNVDTEILDPESSYPPSNGSFRSGADGDYINPIVKFLAETGGPLFASIYPYFAYKANQPGKIPLEYALLDQNYPGVDMPDGTRYQNLFYTLFDAVNAAVEKSVGPTALDIGAGSAPEVKGGESGEPTLPGGGVENAKAYVNNLIRVVKTGSPRRPDRPIETYIFAMFDENQKPGGEDEKNFGLFNPDGGPKYTVTFG